MKLKAIQDRFHKELDAIYGADEVDSIFYLLTEAFYDFSRIELALDPSFAIIEEEQGSIINALLRLKQGEPVQYILGETAFCGLPFKVNQQTLIPRPETEELVQWVIDELSKYESDNPLNILDIGTGSGCIAIALAKYFPQSNVYALDVSSEALKVAKYNATSNKVTVTCIEADILNIETVPITENVLFDVIVSNPPYVRNLEKKAMKANVLKHEPHIALFVEDDNPLQFYEAILKFAVNNLTKKGMLFFEINEYLGKEMKHLLAASQFNSVELKKDLFGKDRMIKGVRD
jgi:release factor glutamine methyltransferase